MLITPGNHFTLLSGNQIVCEQTLFFIIFWKYSRQSILVIKEKASDPSVNRVPTGLWPGCGIQQNIYTFPCIDLKYFCKPVSQQSYHLQTVIRGETLSSPPKHNRMETRRQTRQEEILPCSEQHNTKLYSPYSLDCMQTVVIF